MKKYKLLVCGGTFDLLHKGHKSFLKEIFEYGEKVLIGLTSDVFPFSKNHELERYEKRKENLVNFLNGFTEGRFEITEINDLYGPIIDSKYNGAVIAASEETKEGAYKINNKREEQNLPKLLILSVSMKDAEDGRPISSTRIRNGEIDRDGALYIRPSWRGKNLKLPNSLRQKLTEPFGKVINEVPIGISGAKTVCVGDVTVRKFNERNVGQFLSIVDFVVQRKKEFRTLEDLGFLPEIPSTKVVNSPGSISSELFNAVIDAYKTREEQAILVNGEEDLAVIPVVLSSPLGFKVYYGQPNQGLVEVAVNEKMKKKVFDLVNKFDLE